MHPALLLLLLLSVLTAAPLFAVEAGADTSSESLDILSETHGRFALGTMLSIPGLGFSIIPLEITIRIDSHVVLQASTYAYWLSFSAISTMGIRLAIPLFSQSLGPDYPPFGYFVGPFIAVLYATGFTSPQGVVPGGGGVAAGVLAGGALYVAPGELTIRFQALLAGGSLPDSGRPILETELTIAFCWWLF